MSDDFPNVNAEQSRDRRRMMRALRDNWVTTPDKKQRLIKKLEAIAFSRSNGVSARERIRAVEAIIAASKFESETPDVDAAVTEVTVKVTILPSGMTDDELRLANRAVQAPSESGLL